MIVYSALPYLLAAAPAVIVLLAVLIGGCTMTTTRTANDPIGSELYYSDPNSRAGEELIQEPGLQVEARQMGSSRLRP